MNNKYQAIKDYVQQVLSDRASLNPDLIPSKYWTDFAANFRYVYDLPEYELNRIRYHTYHLTSDSYLTYYFANLEFKQLLIRGYAYFNQHNQFNGLAEGEDGIGIESQYGRISHDLLRYLGVGVDLIAADLLNKTNKMVLEIGGGYGGLARLHLTYNPNMSYCICDLEETLFFSAVYLSRHFGCDKVHLLTERINKEAIQTGHIYISPQSKIDYFAGLQFDYVINQQSFQEMTQQQVERYILWLKQHSQYFYSCNIADHGIIANEKNLVLNLQDLLETYFSKPIWIGEMPLSQNRFGDNHLPRTVYQCQ